MPITRRAMDGMQQLMAQPPADDPNAPSTSSGNQPRARRTVATGRRKRKLTAYQAFLKVKMAGVMKRIVDEWKGLSDMERNRYKAIALQKNN